MNLLNLVFLIYLATGSTLNNELEFAHQNETMEKKILGLRTCVYVVPELDAAKEWYSKAFETKPYFDEPYYVGFNVGGYELALMPQEKDERSTAENVVVYWGVDDIQKVFDDWISMGARIHEKPTNVGGDLMVASVYDPWDNVVGIIYNPVFKAE